MSAPIERRDKVWLCSGCAHGFMFTLRQPVHSFSLVWATTSDDATNEKNTVDSAYCLCSHPTMVHGLGGERVDGASGKEPRAKIGVAVINCDGFKLKEEPK